MVGQPLIDHDIPCHSLPPQACLTALEWPCEIPQATDRKEFDPLDLNSQGMDVRLVD